jgi:hypothetical protein
MNFSTLKKVGVATAISAVLLTGCGSSKPAPKPQAQGCNLAGPNSPMWICIPEVEGGVAAVGSAEKSGAGLSFQRQEAIANARDELARQLSLKVKNMFKNFTQTTGVGDAQTVDKVASNVSKQVASQTLNGSKVINMYQANDGRLFVMVAIKADSVKAATRAAAKSSLKNDKALWQQFQAKKAGAELDAAVDKMTE